MRNPSTLLEPRWSRKGSTGQRTTRCFLLISLGKTGLKTNSRMSSKHGRRSRSYLRSLTSTTCQSPTRHLPTNPSKNGGLASRTSSLERKKDSLRACLLHELRSEITTHCSVPSIPRKCSKLLKARRKHWRDRDSDRRNLRSKQASLQGRMEP